MEINRGLFDALGMTVIDSLWQGAIVMSLAFLGLWFMRKNKASTRHNFLLLCILALPILSVYTFSQRFEKEAAFVETTTVEASALPDPDVSFPSIEVLSTPVISKVETLNWLEMIPWLGLFWTLGLSLVLIRSVGSYVYLSRLKTGANDLSNGEIIRLFNQLKEGFDIKTQVLLRESSKVASPMVYGYFKPIILFPLGLIQGLSMDEVEVILLHELAHLRRNDFLINIVINGLRAVYFYHPVFWWLQSQLDNEREFSADEMVMEKKTDGLVLVRALSKAQEFSMLSPSLGFAGSSKNQLLKRVNRIMKKQQKPNWTGMLLPCAILLSVFLLSSQSEKADLLNLELQPETQEPTELSDTEDNYMSIPLFIRDSLNQLQTTGQTVPLILRKGKSVQSDSVAVAKATMELLDDPSPIDVTADSNGTPIHIKRKGKMLSGEEFNVYQKAYLKLNKYVAEVADTRMSGFMGADDSKVKLQNTGLSYLHKVESQLVAEKWLMDQFVANATANPSEAHGKTLSEQMDKVVQLEKLIEHITVTMDDQQKQVDRLYHENLQQMTTLEQLTLLSLEAKFKAESKEMGKMVYELTSNPKNTDPAAVAKQAEEYARTEEQLASMLGGDAAAKRHIESLKLLDESRYEPLRKANQIQEEKRQQQLIKEEFSALQAKYDSFGGTSYTEEGNSFDFHLGQEGLEVGLDEYANISNGDAILEIDGVLMPDAKLSDFNQDDFVSITIYKGKAQQKRYPNGETKGRVGVISITTKKGAEEKRSKIYAMEGEFSFDNTDKDQKMATELIQRRIKLFDNPVVVFNGKFMPKDYLLKYTDAYIKEINIYKGDALKKFPKRKIKDYDAVIEVVTKKVPRTKN